jgi:hypothetical protein
MKQFLGWVGALLLTTALLVGAARTAGGAQFAPHPLFTDDEGEGCAAPCVLGILPRTSLAQATALLVRHPLFRNAETQLYGRSLSVIASPAATVTISSGRIFTAFLYTAQPVALWQVVAALGGPQEVYYRAIGGGLVSMLLIYEGGYLAVEVRALADAVDQPLSYQAEVTNFALSDRPFFGGYMPLPWRGFALLRRYS